MDIAEWEEGGQEGGDVLGESRELWGDGTVGERRQVKEREVRATVEVVR